MYKGSKQGNRNRGRYSKKKFFTVKESKNIKSKVIENQCSVCKEEIDKDDIQNIINCCADCGYSSYCSKCCFTLNLKDNSTGETKTYVSCGMSIIYKISDLSKESRLDCVLTNEELENLKNEYKSEMKFRIRTDSLSGESFTIFRN